MYGPEHTLGRVAPKPAAAARVTVARCQAGRCGRAAGGFSRTGARAPTGPAVVPAVCRYRRSPPEPISNGMTTPRSFTPRTASPAGAPAATPAAAPTRSVGAPGADYVRFCEGVRKATGIDLGQYRPGQMERRLRSFAQRQGVADLDAYLSLLTRNPQAMDAFLDRMTINVSELFRNPERFVDIEQTVLPSLLSRSPGALKVWSAGCSYGAEVYSLMVLLREVAPNGRHEVLAADIDNRILARAKEGIFSPSDMRNVTPARRGKWFSEKPGPTWQVNDELRRAVNFRQMDLLRDTFPTGFDLIACRNVVIYFNDDAKDVLYRRFFDALKPGGILFVGSTERVNNAEQMGWQKAGTFFYQKPF